MSPEQIDRIAKEYNDNPNYCVKCNQKIHLTAGKVAKAKNSKFCSRNCFLLDCQDRKILAESTRQKRQPRRRLLGMGKIELFRKTSNWQSARSMIQKHARDIFKNSLKPKECCACGYNKHYEVCHIKSVSSFEDGDILEEINNISNLIALCPNCHWEFDNGYLVL